MSGGPTSDYYAPGSLSLAFYDLMAALAARHLAADVDFYAALAGPPPAAVLEVGAGTGRVARALAERGYDVVGLDRSAEMLAVARRTAATVPGPGQARYLCADMTRFALDRRFALVIAPFYAFSHLDSDDQRRLALGCMRDHLTADGRIVLHLVRAEVLAAAIPADALDGQRTTVRLDGRALELRVRVAERLVDRRRQVCEQRIEYVLVDGAGTERRRSVETLRYGWMRSDQRDRLLAATGLRLLERRSAFTGDPGGEDILVLGVGRSPSTE
ncbi:class I SAM-dependent methyltransferase [Azospirillum sp. ST 5-10]|uniref:class I SAM-dependent methyltransferase n=1 Tax=unclassified Azospirillum TaxID=2630922 RepID=UPI003F4A25F4